MHTLFRDLGIDTAGIDNKLSIRIRKRLEHLALSRWTGPKPFQPIPA